MEQDFSHLPEVAWVEIMKYLPLMQRARLASTCQTLNSVFNHPSLWHTVQMHLLGDLKPYNYKNQAVLFPNQYKEMAQRFGRYFQNLSLKVTGYVKEVPSDCKQVLLELSKTCRLETLTMHVGTMVSRDYYLSVNPKDDDLRVFSDLVGNSFRLKSFTLTSWPKFPGKTTLDILDSLRENNRLLGLNDLHLYSYRSSHGSWITNNAILPTHKTILELVQRFSSLTSISMRSNMLTEDIFSELASAPREPLKNLGVLVTYTDREKHTRMNAVSGNIWAKLCTYCPNLKVEYTIMTRVPHIELSGVLCPEIPLHTIRFLKYSRCGTMDINSITDKFNSTLTSFLDYSDSNDCDLELISMVTKCSKLDWLVYNGNLYTETVLTLARLRGKYWRKFSVNMDNVITKPLNDEDEDIVIRVGPDGNLVTPLTHTYESDEERSERLASLQREITAILGYNLVFEEL